MSTNMYKTQINIQKLRINRTTKEDKKLKLKYVWTHREILHRGYIQGFKCIEHMNLQNIKNKWFQLKFHNMYYCRNVLLLIKTTTKCMEILGVVIFAVLITVNAAAKNREEQVLSISVGLTHSVNFSISK